MDGLLMILLAATLSGATYHALRRGRVPPHLLIVTALLLGTLAIT